MTRAAGAVVDELEEWLSWQQYRSDTIGELARQLHRGDVRISNLPSALRPALTAARMELMARGPILTGEDVSERVAEIRDAAGLRTVPA